MLSETESLSDDNSMSENSGTLQNERRFSNYEFDQNTVCDVSLITDSGAYDAHKSVLAASSDYFKAMFASNMVESTMHSIVLRDINGCLFRRILDYIYDEQIEISGCDDAIELLQVSVYFQINSLINCSSAFLKVFMTAESACVVSLVARELGLKDLLISARSYLITHFNELDEIDSNAVLLTPENMKECLQSDHLAEESNSSSELIILKIVLRWLLYNHDISESEQHQILSQVRFALIPVPDLKMICRKVVSEKKTSLNPANINNVFGSVFHCYLAFSLQYHQQIYAQPLVQCGTTNLRSPIRTWVSVDGVLANSPIRLASGFKQLKPSHFRQHAAIRDPFHSVVEYNGFLFVLGGTRHIEEGYSNHVMRYDPRLDVWCKMASMLECRGDFVAIAYRGFIYVFGGRNRFGVLKTCESYDISTNTWQHVASLPEPLYMSAGVVTDGVMMLCGGFNQSEATNKTLFYNPANDQWKQISSTMIAERGYHVMIEGVDGQMWVVGGIDDPFSGRNVWMIEAFDKSKMEWRLAGQLLPVSPFLSVRRLNIFNNEEGHICLSTVTCPEKYSTLQYDITKKVWINSKARFTSVNFNVDSKSVENSSFQRENFQNCCQVEWFTKNV